MISPDRKPCESGTCPQIAKAKQGPRRHLLRTQTGRAPELSATPRPAPPIDPPPRRRPARRRRLRHLTPPGPLDLASPAVAISPATIPTAAIKPLRIIHSPVFESLFDPPLRRHHRPPVPLPSSSFTVQRSSFPLSRIINYQLSIPPFVVAGMLRPVLAPSSFSIQNSVLSSPFCATIIRHAAPPGQLSTRSGATATPAASGGIVACRLP